MATHNTTPPPEQCDIGDMTLDMEAGVLGPINNSSLTVITAFPRFSDIKDE